VLAEFNRAGALDSADVQVAARLAGLVNESDESVRLAVALAVRAARAGSVCVDLATVAQQPMELEGEVTWPDAAQWPQRVAASAVAEAGLVRLAGSLLYLDRHWREEEQVHADVMARLALTAPKVDELMLEAGALRLFAEGWEEQRHACLAAARQWTTVLTGGPGTGKTASVARMLLLMGEQFEHEAGRAPRIGLAAPTGKAATRLQESVARERATLTDPSAGYLDALGATTMQRLLGTRFPDSSTRFRHHRENRLPFDIIVIDEVSMLPLSMMARLLEAVRPDTRLILVGDPDQLASVEAGNVLADLVQGLALLGQAQPEGPAATVVQRLVRTHRFEAGAALDQLAAAVRADDADRVVALLTAGDGALSLVDPEDDEALKAAELRVVDAAFAVTLAADRVTRAEGPLAEDDGRAVTDLLDAHRLLCAHRTGPYGVSSWNRQIQRLLAERTGVTHYTEWFPGRPVLITANDRGLGLSNGDLGVTVSLPDGRLRVLVRLGEKAVAFATTRLASAETVYAMTVHKSQGSEARAVTVVLPAEDSPLLTRELFYTAVTRAQEQVTVIGTEASLRAALARRVVRASGLALRLAGRLPGQ
jgi:exodeoxyribonuclease V alpha subunit